MVPSCILRTLGISLLVGHVLFTLAYPTEIQGAAPPKPVLLDFYGDPLPDGAVARLGTVRFNWGTKSAVRFSPDGRYLVSVGDGGNLLICDSKTGSLLRHFKVHCDDGELVALSGDGKWVATASSGKSTVIYLYDIVTGKKGHSLHSHPDRVNAFAFSGDGLTLASCGGDSVCVWDLATGRRKHWRRGIPGKKKGETFYWKVCFSPDSRTFAATDTGGMIHFWDTIQWKILGILAGRSTSVDEIAFSPNGKQVFSAGTDGMVRLWDMVTGKQVRRFGEKIDFINRLTVSPDGRSVVVSSMKGMVFCWDVPTGKELWRIQQPRRVTLAGFSPDGKMLVANTSSTQRIVLLDAITGICLNPTSEPMESVTRLAYSLDGKIVAAVCRNRSIVVWNAQSCKELSRRSFPETTILSIRICSPSRVLVATVDNHSPPQGEAQLRMWDMAIPKELGRIDWHSYQYPDTGIIQPVGKSILTSGFHRVEMRHWPTGRILQRFCDYEDRLRRQSQNFPPIATSPDGSLLAAGSWSHSPPGWSMWDTLTGQRLGQFGSAKADAYFIAFSADGRSVFSQNAARPRENDLYLWEAGTGQVRLCIPGPQGGIDKVAFSPDGRLLATSGYEGGIFLRDLVTGWRCNLFENQSISVPGYLGIRTSKDRATPLVFSPNGKYLLTGGENGTIVVWDVNHFLPPKKRSPAKLSQASLEALWTDLAGQDAVKAYQAVVALSEHRGSVEAFLTGKLKKQAAPLGKVGGLITQLDSEDFSLREKASRQLEALGRLAEGALRENLRQKLSLEAATRTRRLLLYLGASRHRPEELQTMRALEVFHRLGIPKKLQDFIKAR